ncbi:hypothetical protein JTB14_026493 [Gonioctena quinquepunctata]|nr:hypothetical protein JTB14_026493 [Gonioctena quinquepunctata]
MFWGLIMEPQRRYTQKVKKSFHISMASMDVSTSSEEPAQVMCGFEGRNYLLCTLRKPDLLQCPLDLNFEVGDELSLAANGKCHVHLTGYLTEDFSNLEEEEEDDEETEEVEVAEEKKQKKNQKRNKNEVQINGPPTKKSKVASPSKEEEESDEDDDSDIDVKALLDKSLADSDDDDETFASDDAIEALEEEDDDDDDEEDEDDDSEEPEEEQEEEDSSMSDSDEVEAKNQKHQKSKKAKQNGLPMKQEQKKEKDNKKQQQNESKSPKKEQQSPKKKTLQGGVMIEEIREGQGPPAKNGKFVSVYYEGRLKQNNKMFDSTNKGAGFSFRLGSGEVIKGWDVGVAGMKVGGKRKITCPPAMAYGAKGSPPAIPGNSVLVFEVELKKVR